MLSSRVLLLTLLAAAALPAFLLGPGLPSQAATPIADPIPGPIPQGIAVRLETLATGLTAPGWGTAAPGDPQHLFVTDQSGVAWRIDVGTGAKSVFLDVTSRLVPLGIFGPGSFDERGLLGLAFSPGYAANGLVYTYTSEPVSGPADFSTMPPSTTANHQSVIAEWNVPNPGNPLAVVDTNSRRELLRIDEPQFNHNAGTLTFGPDGLLYISLGDGGGADDQDGQPFIGGPVVGHGPGGNGQDTGVVLGKILRINPAGTNSANGKYGNPGSNPFVGQPGLDEIYAYGLRNPYRFSFDQGTGQMYIGDVGQNKIEEIDLGAAGANYGWRHKEGSFFFDPNGTGAGFVTNVDPGVPPGLVDPIAQYDHDEGLAVVGGFVYRGSAVPALYGRYVFGDFARTFASDGRLFYLDGAQVTEFKLTNRTVLGLALLGFGQDAAGEVYVMANATGTPFGSTGVVLRIAPPTVGGSVELPADGRTRARTADGPAGGDALPVGVAAALAVGLAFTAAGWYAWRRRAR